MSNGFCVNYLLLISLGGIVILTYIGFLCLFDIEELKVEEKHHHSSTVFISAAIYLFLFIIMIGIKCRKRQVLINPQGYQVLDEAS